MDFTQALLDQTQNPNHMTLNKKTLKTNILI